MAGLERLRAFLLVCLIKFKWYIAGIACAGAYYPLRHLMIDQESKVTVIASTLTVILIVSLYAIGWSLQKLSEKYLAGRNWILRWGAIGAGIFLLFIYLDLVGYGVRW